VPTQYYRFARHMKGSFPKFNPAAGLAARQ
jgi:hypothetical protein